MTAKRARSVVEAAATAAAAAAAAMAAGPTLRADARKNRARVLEVARAVFAAEGLAVPLDEIARRAGVGIGTVYRHFPTKETLFAAIVHDRLARLAEDAARLAAAPLPAAAFHDFLARMMVELKGKRDLSEALVGAGIDLKAATAAPGAALRKGFDALLRRARNAGAVRSGISVDDVLALVSAAIHAAGKTGGSAERLLSVISDGLRPPRGPRRPGR